jgi:release factor H-coupled RctB family protein
LNTAHLPLTAAELAASLGTIGGGNHFAELLQIDTVYAADANLDKARAYLLVHSGSRGLGGAILRQHVDAHGHAGLQAASIEAAAYLAQHDAALAYAKLNREWIARRMLAAWKTQARCLLDVSHNHVVAKQHPRHSWLFTPQRRDPIRPRLGDDTWLTRRLFVFGRAH